MHAVTATFQKNETTFVDEDTLESVRRSKLEATNSRSKTFANGASGVERWYLYVMVGVRHHEALMSNRPVTIGELVGHEVA